MGIESDRMVFDYLSRVGDLAQQQHLPPGERSALVAGLRDEIDRRRATRGEESPAAVRGILGDLGTPDEVVGRAAATAEPAAPGPDGSPRTEPSARPAEGRAAWWAGGATPPAGPPRPRGASDAGGGRTDAPAEPAPVPRPRATGASAAARADDWWFGGPGGPGDDDGEPIVPGFVGGVEAPELFRPPEPEAPEEEGPGEPAAPASRARRLARLLLRRRPAEAAEAEPEEEAPARASARRGFAHPFLLLAALLLLAGAVFGWLLALAAGWLIAYGSRRLTPGEVKTAVFVLPGLAAAGGVAWLWGRVEGRWGEPIAAGGDAMGAAVAATWPWTLKAAAAASALYLLWRARRA
ncbi:hypothetical protein AB0E83_14915 [Streptomyces sp. NPDC035033]|uniref:hypothetical protein n=1 Tax=Streptomyces sp. NPDC035033 TaxID=3155368 RepID=UPI00340B666B